VQNDNSHHILELLSFTKAHNHYRDALNRATGEHFNIFKILGIGRYEVKTHSPILGELLNPEGRHGQGVVFLRLFLDHFGITDFDAESAKLDLEFPIGPVTPESGGRIDILIKDGKGKMILIENKIDAVDQPNQMKRYYNFARKNTSQFYLFYLTLDGHEPSDLSEDDLDRIKCKRITYNGEILTWLNDCRKESACLPNVRETINQYIHLIEELTNINMDKEIINKITESKESLHAFHTLYDALWLVRAELITRLDGYLNSLATKHKLERVDSKLGKAGPLSNLQEKDAQFCFTTKGLRQHDLLISFGFDKGNFADLYFGFRYGKATDDHRCPVEKKLLDAFTGKFPDEDQPTPYFPASAWWKKYQRCDDIFEAICSGDFEKDLDEKLGRLTEIANQFIASIAEPKPTASPV
jgi:hypothetical protein